MPQEWARKRHMPRLAQTPTDDMQNQTVGTFQFSAIRPDRLGGVEWTLVNIALDASPSISGQQQAIADACVEALTACQKSPRANNLVARVSTFGDYGEGSPRLHAAALPGPQGLQADAARC
jgi:hypothetical protein